jgi:hypothetical protein
MPCLVGYSRVFLSLRKESSRVVQEVSSQNDVLKLLVGDLGDRGLVEAVDTGLGDESRIGECVAMMNWAPPFAARASTSRNAICRRGDRGASGSSRR